MAESPWSIATFSADITIPLGHRCMGVLKTKSQRIDDPLEAIGFVIKGPQPAIILVALDWCEVRNDSYQDWRKALARAADTSVDRVMLCSLHQHDAPVVDAGAQAYLDGQGLQGELFDRDFHARCVQDVVNAMNRAMNNARPLTHMGFGESLVKGIASNRRVQHPDGRVRFDRYSSMRRDSHQARAGEGEIDPYLKTITFFDHAQPVVALSCYATHPMSHYGKGAVSGDFVALARRRIQHETPGTRQIYVTGCSGDVTAGKYNDGSPSMRGILADRLYVSMKSAWDQATLPESTTPLSESSIHFRCEKLDLPFHKGEEFRRESMLESLSNQKQSIEDRITAAMGLSSLDRVERGEPIDLPCVDFGGTKLVLLPGESFVRYQRMAQAIAAPDRVIAVGYGECWPGYIPSEDAFREGFDHGWRWVAAGCEAIISRKLNAVLKVTKD